MATEAQILANRRNPQKSTGPRTLSMILGAPGDLFMQNKANFYNTKMNENLFAAKVYENETTLRLEQNKPKQSQFLDHWLRLLFIIKAKCHHQTQHIVKG